MSGRAVSIQDHYNIMLFEMRARLRYDELAAEWHKPKIMEYGYEYWYSDGTVTIVTPGKEGIAQEATHGNSVLVFDYRRGEDDPNMVIVDSYRITNRDQQIEIIRILLRYNDADTDSPWFRTEPSMLVEWNIHNVLYAPAHGRRYKDADLDNNDEYGYWLLYVMFELGY